jgi:hypothetical protein
MPEIQFFVEMALDRSCSCTQAGGGKRTLLFTAARDRCVVQQGMSDRTTWRVGAGGDRADKVNALERLSRFARETEPVQGNGPRDGRPV